MIGSLSAGAQFTLSFVQAVDLTQVEIYEQADCGSSGWMAGLSVGKFQWQLVDLQSVGGFTSGSARSVKVPHGDYIDFEENG